MKTYLINIFILLLFFVAYSLDFFGWFTGRKPLFFAILLVFVMLIIGWKVIGNPFNEGKNNDKND